MSNNPEWITAPKVSFAGLPVCTQFDNLNASIAILGLHFKSPYPPSTDGVVGIEKTAPEAIRRQSSVFRDHFAKTN